jgi:glutathione S-transferase
VNDNKNTVAKGQFTIYHIEERRSERVIWLLEELGLPYTLAFKPGDLMASLQLAREGHLMGMVPVFRDGDTVVVESGAILEYIIARYANGRFAVPAASTDYPKYIQWMHFAEGSAASRIILEFLLRSAIPEGVEPSFLVARNLDGTRRVMDVAEQALATSEYFAGATFTAADIMMVMPMKLARSWGVELSAYPHVARWLEKVQARPAYQRAVAAGSPNGPLPAVAMINRKLLADTGKISPAA